MLSIWWDVKGVVYYELLPAKETITADKYCAQLDRLKASIAENRPVLANRKGVIFHHDNARPHVALSVKNKLAAFNWEVLIHPPYSPGFTLKREKWEIARLKTGKSTRAEIKTANVKIAIVMKAKSQKEEKENKRKAKEHKGKVALYKI